MSIVHARIVVVVCALTACRSRPTPAPTADAAVDAQTVAPTSPFVIIARAPSQRHLELRRANGGPAFLVTNDGVPASLFELGSAGTLTPYKRISSDAEGSVGEIGIAPEGVTEMEIEQWTSSVSTHAAVFGVAGSSFHLAVDGERRVGWFPWRDGSVLVLRSDTTTSMVSGTPWIYSHTARFEALTAVGKALPAVPPIPSTLVHADRFAAYPSGRVFLLAATKDDQIPPAWSDRALHDLGGVAKPVPLPDGFEITNAVIAGERESDLLIAAEDARQAGKPMLAALDPVKRTLARIEITGAELPFKSVSRADDGELWFVTGWLHEREERSYYGQLYRGRVKDGHLEAKRVRLPPCPPDAKTPCAEMTPLFVAASGREDVWVTVKEANKDPDYGDEYLLHLQAQAPATVTSIDNARLENEAWADIPPRPYKIRCRTSLLVLGPAATLEEAKITAAARTIRGTPPSAERGRVGGEDVWALRLTGWSDETPDPNAGVVKGWKRALPTAKIVCAGMLTKKELVLQSLAEDTK